jgi:hypothetical protein
MSDVYGGQPIWIFMGEKGTCPMGAWSLLDAAHKYIHDEALTGVLIRYDLDEPIYEAAKSSGRFKPTKDQQRSVKFRQTFNWQFQEHYTFREGHCEKLGNPKCFE